LSEVTLDGTDLTETPRIIRHAIQSRGELTVEDCIIKNIKTNNIYYGRGIVLLAGTSNTIARCEFSDIQRIGIHVRGHVELTDPIAYIEDCTYVGKGDGDWLDYGIEFGGGGSGTVDGCDISACTGVASVDGSTSAGIYATDYWGTGTVATVENSILTGNSDGICVGYVSTDATVLTAHCNDISGNTVYGIRNVGTVEVDAENNWWGDASGPSVQGPGTGDAVSTNVDYDPWIASLIYTGAPQPTANVVLEATLSDSTLAGMSGYTVDFYIDNDYVGSATTDSDGVASCNIGLYPVGIYDVYASVCCLESDPALLAIYDPAGGFVTGGGWIDSPLGAHVANPNDPGGKANFGFVSKYKKGQSTPTGNTEFQFKAGNLNFHSDSYDWLVIAGSKAKYKGTGAINDEGSYKFMLSAIDGDPNSGDGIDKFRINIWEEDTNGDETIIYDNGEGTGDVETLTELGGGQIVIHKAKTKAK
jgi:hypothetical protein